MRNKNQRARNGTPLNMILARVLLGRAYVCQAAKSYKRAPCSCNEDNCKDARHKGSAYHSVIGTHKNPTDQPLKFREFVVYEKCSSYPEFLIEYERRWPHGHFLATMWYIHERYIHCSLVFKSINLLCNLLFRNSWPVCDFCAPVAKLQKWYCAALRHTVSVFQLGYLQECECRCLVPKGWLSRMLGLHCVAWWNSSYSRDTLRAVIIQRVWRRVGSKILTPYWRHPVLFKFQS